MLDTEDGEHGSIIFGDLQEKNKEGNCRIGCSGQSGLEMESDTETTISDPLPKNKTTTRLSIVQVNTDEDGDLAKLVEDNLEDDLDSQTETNLNTSANLQMNQEEDVFLNVDIFHNSLDINTLRDL